MKITIKKHQKETFENKINKIEKKVNVKINSIKERVIPVYKDTKIGSCETKFGISQIVNLESKNHKYVWFTSANIDKLKEGEQYIIKKAIIKKRDEYRGIKNHVIKIITTKNIEGEIK